MVGMTALVGMCEHDLGLELPHECQYPVAQFLQMECKLLICEMESCDRVFTNPSLGQSLNGLFPARLRIFFSGCKPGGEGISGIQR